MEFAIASDSYEAAAEKERRRVLVVLFVISICALFDLLVKRVWHGENYVSSDHPDITTSPNFNVIAFP